jgi:hypothetical protein
MLSMIKTLPAHLTLGVGSRSRPQRIRGICWAANFVLVRPSTFMFRYVLIFFTVLLPGLALAKRAAPAKVEPVTHQGVRYIAPNDDGRRAYIEAWDVQTKKKLWDLTVFTNRIDPKLEEDVQHVFIKTLRVRDGTLIVTSECGETYRVDLKTKAVTQSEPGELSPTASLESLLALLFRFGIALPL